VILREVRRGRRIQRRTERKAWVPRCPSEVRRIERSRTSILALELFADVGSLGLGIHEIFLAGETGAVFLFVV
jgi:hypothetical protein